MDLGKTPLNTRIFLFYAITTCVLALVCVTFYYKLDNRYNGEIVSEKIHTYNIALLNEHSSQGKDTSRITPQTAPFPNVSSIITTPSEAGIEKPLIEEAIRKGNAYEYSRHPIEFTTITYRNGLLVITTANSSPQLHDALKPDLTFIWVILSVCACLCVGSYVITRTLSKTIRYLSKFASKAVKGEPLYSYPSFPDSNLGQLCHKIALLYENLQQTTQERNMIEGEVKRKETETAQIKRDLTNNINHELKTPIAAIQVCLETLISNPDISAEKRAVFLGRCFDNCRRLQTLLSDVSTLTRLEEGSSLITIENTNLLYVIDDAIAEFPSTEESPALPITIDAPVDGDIEGNHSLLTSVFRNLIANANAYSQGTAIYITIRMADAETYEVKVRDNGIGVPEEHIARIFERFYRLDKGRSREKGGTGLGLSIVKNAVKFHGGQVHASNHPEGGLEMTLTLKVHH